MIGNLILCKILELIKLTNFPNCKVIQNSRHIISRLHNKCVLFVRDHVVSEKTIWWDGLYLFDIGDNFLYGLEPFEVSSVIESVR
jgi:hypothetical protein